jgi:hypothetical protein
MEINIRIGRQEKEGRLNLLWVYSHHSKAIGVSETLLGLFNQKHWHLINCG